MIVVTGAAGFIGSCMVGKLNNKGVKDLVMVDDFSKTEKHPNIANKIFLDQVDRRQFFSWLDKNAGEVEFIFHIGARTDTTEFNMAVFDELNLSYTKKIWNACSEYRIPMIYASSAATYGDGSLGYDDTDNNLIDQLQPLNPYGISKNEFDKWALRQAESPPRWYGLKFFNVFGPNEYHKGRMASVVFHAFNQVGKGTGGQVDKGTRGQGDRGTGGQGDGVVRLFRSHHQDYSDGGQLRDFIYVKDVLDVLWYLMQNPVESGIYNLGTGKSRTFLDLGNAVFKALDLSPAIEFIDTPADIRDKYQYFTEAKMDKLRATGYSKPFYTLEAAVTEYVQGYLVERIWY
ncbi:MAG: ADP-glyceromanno-heptose 6-epimerase [Bacteroidales bacterium]|nr:ADP-glyceromanno-heptose 6-epimerase [Bacteroidales bacterium]